MLNIFLLLRKEYLTKRFTQNHSYAKEQCNRCLFWASNSRAKFCLNFLSLIIWDGVLLMCDILPLLVQFKYSKCINFWILYSMDDINYYLPTFPSWTLILPRTQRNVAGCISQYFIGLLNKLIALYNDFFIFGTVGQKSFTPTFVIEL